MGTRPFASILMINDERSPNRLRAGGLVCLSRATGQERQAWIARVLPVSHCEMNMIRQALKKMLQSAIRPDLASNGNARCSSNRIWQRMAGNGRWQVVGLVLEYTLCRCSMLYIHPKHRRQGIGAQLLRHAESSG
jgi:hypothetical protein